MLSLFIVAIQEDWPSVMHQAQDATDVDKGPIENNNPLYAYFFIAFMLIGSYFFLNFFIGVLFVKYKEAEKNENKGFS